MDTGLSGMIGLTLNDKALDRWAKSLHISGIVEKGLMKLNDNSEKKDVTTRKEESPSRIKSNSVDRQKMRNFLTYCLHPFYIAANPDNIVNIYSGGLSTEGINVDN